MEEEEGESDLTGSFALRLVAAEGIGRVEMAKADIFDVSVFSFPLLTANDVAGLGAAVPLPNALSGQRGGWPNKRGDFALRRQILAFPQALREQREGMQSGG